MVFDPNDPNFDPFLDSLLDEHHPENLNELMERWKSMIPPMQPLHIEDGKLLGDVDKLSFNVIYNLGDKHLLQLIPSDGGQGSSYRVYVNTGNKAAPVKHDIREICEVEGQLESALAELIKKYGPVSIATPEQNTQVARYLHELEKGETHMAQSAAYDVAHLLEGHKFPVSDAFSVRLKQAVEGTLESPYTDLLKIDKMSDAAEKGGLNPEAAGINAVHEPVLIEAELDELNQPLPIEPSPVVRTAMEPPKIAAERVRPEPPVLPPLKAPELPNKAAKVEEAVEHAGGKGKWLWAGGLIAGAVAIGAYMSGKKKSKTEQEAERRANSATQQIG